MWHFIANIILRFKYFIIGVITLLTVFFGYEAATNLKLDNKYGFILPKESPAKMDYIKFKEQFGEEGGALVLAIQTDSLFTQDILLKWKELGDSILMFDGVQGVVSEATLYNIENSADKKSFDVRKIFSDTRFQEKSIEQIKKEVKQVPFYKNVLYNDSTNVSLMMVHVQEDYLSDQQKANVVLKIEKLAESYEAYFNKVHFAGLPHIRVVISKRIIAEMYIFIALSILVTSLLTYLIFRSARVVFICNLVISIAVIWSLGSIALFGFHISVLMALIPPLMIVIGTPNCVFLMTKFHQEIKHHGNKIRAITHVIKKVGTSTLTTNIITALGFFTLAFTNSEKLMEFGIISSMNILVLFFLSITLQPIISTLSKKPTQKQLRHLDGGPVLKVLNGMIYLVEYRRKLIYALTIITIGFSIWGITKVKATGNITGDLAKDHQIIRDLHFIEDHFGGSIPFEVIVDYKDKDRLYSHATLEKIEQIQQFYAHDSVLSKSVSIVDFMKGINMAYYGNDTAKYSLFDEKDKKIIESYISNFDVTSINNSLKIKEILDTTNTCMRVRMQIKDLGSYEISDKTAHVKREVDSILNPNKTFLETAYSYAVAGQKNYIDSILTNADVMHELVNIMNDNHVKVTPSLKRLQAHYEDANFNKYLRKAIDKSYYEASVTGTAVVAAEGTIYLVDSLLEGIVFAVVTVGLLMALLFRSWSMVFISLVPNLIPLLITGGVMGFMGIPLKPSTLLVFNISFGITADDSVHFLAKYRQELKSNKWTSKESIIEALKESGLGMFYTSIILFFGFSVFMLSQFGGTKVLGILVSMTLLVAVCINLILVPSILLSLEKRMSKDTLNESFLDVYDEDIEKLTNDDDEEEK